jgi:hypothetical protein
VLLIPTEFIDKLMSSPAIKSPSPVGSLPDWLEIVRRKVESLSFGVVQIVVHYRRVTQIERTEKTRLDAPAADGRHRGEND